MPIEPLSVSDSDIKVINAALAKLGVRPIASFTENSAAGRAANELYANALESALAAYPWRFAREQFKLTRSGEAPVPWKARWALPSAALAVHGVFENDTRVAFDVFGRAVVTETPDNFEGVLRAEATGAPAPSVWPGYFREGFITSLAGVLAMPLTQDAQMAQGYQQAAARALTYARSRDAQGRSPSRIDTKLFIRQRRGGSR